jgi:hypothetical protein
LIDDAREERPLLSGHADGTQGEVEGKDPVRCRAL